MVDLIIWSADFDRDSAVDKVFLQKAKADRPGLLLEIDEKLRKDHLSV